MQFLFSSPIDRLPYIIRCILTHAVIALLTIHISAIAFLPEASMLDLGISFVLDIAVFVYVVRFVVLARLESLGLSYWYGVLLSCPLLAGLSQWFLGFQNTFAIVLGVVYLLFILVLFLAPKGAFDQGNPIQATLYDFEAGESQFLTRLVPLIVALIVIAGTYNLVLFHGLNDVQSMDNAQLARQIARGEGYTTRFLRPQAVADLRNHAAKQSLLTGQPPELFPAAQYPAGAPRVVPDTYNAPGYPYLLAAWFKLVHPDFNQAVSPQLDGFVAAWGSQKTSPVYNVDRWIPPLNLIFMLLTGGLVFRIGRRLFDDRVAWLSVAAFFATNLIWQYSVTGQSTSFLMFLVTGMICCTLEIFCVSESCFESEEQSFGPAWGWAVALSVLLAAACLTRLHLLVFLLPLLVLLIVMPRPSWLMFIMIALIGVGSVLPWFWHMYKVIGNPLGSNTSYILFGAPGYTENQIFCATSIPTYESLFRNLSQKEMHGFHYHFEQWWDLLGTNPFIVLFLASLTHAYKRRRAQMFQWFLVGTALVLIGANNFGVTEPEPISAWNVLVLLFPGMIVVGSAFFFIQLDRLNIQVWILNQILVIIVFAITFRPLLSTLIAPNYLMFAFPPYMPPLIKILGGYAKPDEWVTTDMPWAAAWYADRASLWLPDSVSEFTTFNDNLCPTGVLFFTPVTWSKPTSNILNGEMRDWLPFVTGNNIPSTFPLSVHTSTPRGGPDYFIWSDRPRWQTQ